MEYENHSDSFLEELWNAASAALAEPLPEDTKEPEEEFHLECRVEALELRLGRALLCLDQCRKDQAGLQKWCREQMQEQRIHQRQQERRGAMAKYGVCTVIGLMIALEMKGLAALGWALFEKLALLIHVEPGMVSGLLLIIVILWLAGKLTRVLVQKRLSRPEKGEGGDAVCDR